MAAIEKAKKKKKQNAEHSAPRLRSVTPPRVNIVKKENGTTRGTRRTAVGSAAISGKLGTPQQVLMMAE